MLEGRRLRTVFILGSVGTALAGIGAWQIFFHSGHSEPAPTFTASSMPSTQPVERPEPVVATTATATATTVTQGPARLYWSVSKSGPLDPKKFDAEAFLPKAEADARSRWSDATLVWMSAVMVGVDGLSDLTNDENYPAVSYAFRPVAASGKKDAVCAHWVYVDAHGAWTDTRNDLRICSLDLKVPHAPKRACRIPDVLARLAQKYGAQSERTRVLAWIPDEVNGRFERSTVWHWDFQYPTTIPEKAGTSWQDSQIPDDCGGAAARPRSGQPR